MELTDESLMPWGKFKGEKMIDVPTWYLDWLYGEMVEKGYNSTSSRELKIYIDENRDVINKQLKNKNYDT